MAKEKQQFRCATCQYVSIKWIGCCPQCQEWNSFIEEISRPHQGGGMGALVAGNTHLRKFQDIGVEVHESIVSGIQEWDRVMGGGILPGSFIILTGDPGIGKSTLLLQVAHTIAKHHSVYYFSSEESLNQVKKRALRLGIQETNVCFAEQSYLEEIVRIGGEHKPHVIILDSIQNCYFASQTSHVPGSITHLRDAGFALMKLAKENNIVVLITGHITKEGFMAGPKVLEHMVDGVFYLQSADQWHTRILRSVKNRFGTVHELGFFHMHEQGMEQITDINQYLIGQPSDAPGAVLTCELEGSRPLLLELQALCVTSKFGIPQRVITGIDPKRILLIAAILEKYVHVKLSGQDIFFKVSGGVKIQESVSDMAIALALLSSYFQKPLPLQTLALGEVSLAGNIKPVNHVTPRIKEAEKFGIKSILLARDQKIQGIHGVMRFSKIQQLLTLFPENET